MSTNTTALAIVPRSIEEAETMAKRLSESSLIPMSMQKNMANVLVTILAGQELGLAPMAALRSIHVIDGKPILSADGMVALVLGSGKCEYFDRVEETDTSVTYETKRVGATKPRRCTWTLAQAKAAALDKKDNWRLYPRAMLASRAKSELARDVYSDVLAGVYTDDEVQRSGPVTIEHAQSTPANDDIIDAEVVSDTAAPPELAQLEAATTKAELKALASTLANLAEPYKTQARVRYSERLREVPS